MKQGQFTQRQNNRPPERSRLMFHWYGVYAFLSLSGNNNKYRAGGVRYAGPEKSSEGETVKKQRRWKGKRAAGDLTVNIWPHIYTHTQIHTQKEDRKQGTLNTQWCFELRCMTSETESASLSMLQLFTKKDQNNLSMVENKHAEKQM